MHSPGVAFLCISICFCIVCSLARQHAVGLLPEARKIGHCGRASQRPAESRSERREWRQREDEAVNAQPIRSATCQGTTLRIVQGSVGCAQRGVRVVVQAKVEREDRWLRRGCTPHRSMRPCRILRRKCHEVRVNFNYQVPAFACGLCHG